MFFPQNHIIIFINFGWNVCPTFQCRYKFEVIKFWKNGLDLSLDVPSRVLFLGQFIIGENISDKKCKTETLRYIMPLVSSFNTFTLTSLWRYTLQLYELIWSKLCHVSHRRMTVYEYFSWCSVAWTGTLYMKV
jgi:hypothetical protein